MVLRTVLLAGMALVVSGAPAWADAPSTAPLAAVLKASVQKDGKVDYVAARAHVAELDAYLKTVAAADPLKLGKDAKAFYINAYNALVLKAVLVQQDAAGGKLKSVLDVKGFFDGLTYTVAGETLTLNRLEEQRLRKAFNDPRIHFAVNCASASCPVLQPEPWATATLDASLDIATKAYFSSSHGLKTTAAGATTSELLKWYADDFGGTAGATTFLLKFAPPASHAAIQKQLGFHAYDWALNAK